MPSDAPDTMHFALPATIGTALQSGVAMSTNVAVPFAVTPAPPPPGKVIGDIAMDGGTTSNARSTTVAAFQFALPAWLACTVHVPTAVVVTELPAIEHPPLTVKPTGSPAFVVALTVSGAPYSTRSASGSNVIACVPLATW